MFHTTILSHPDQDIFFMSSSFICLPCSCSSQQDLPKCNSAAPSVQSSSWISAVGRPWLSLYLYSVRPYICVVPNSPLQAVLSSLHLTLSLEDRVLFLYTTVSLVPITTVCSVILAGQGLERGRNAKDLPALAKDCLIPAQDFTAPDLCGLLHTHSTYLTHAHICLSVCTYTQIYIYIIYIPKIKQIFK